MATPIKKYTVTSVEGNKYTLTSKYLEEKTQGLGLKRLYSVRREELLRVPGDSIPYTVGLSARYSSDALLSTDILYVSVGPNRIGCALFSEKTMKRILKVMHIPAKVRKYFV